MIKVLLLKLRVDRFHQLDGAEGRKEACVRAVGGRRGGEEAEPTPADEHVDGEVDGVVVDDEQQHVQVETFNQQPEEVGHDEVVEEHQAGFTAHLQTSCDINHNNPLIN